MSKMSKFMKDSIERVLWTGVQASAGAASVVVWDLPPWAGILVATLIAAVKSAAAKHVGESDSASTVPGI